MRFTFLATIILATSVNAQITPEALYQRGLADGAAHAEKQTENRIIFLAKENAALKKTLMGAHQKTEAEALKPTQIMPSVQSPTPVHGTAIPSLSQAAKEEGEDD